MYKQINKEKVFSVAILTLAMLFFLYSLTRPLNPVSEYKEVTQVVKAVKISDNKEPDFITDIKNEVFDLVTTEEILEIEELPIEKPIEVVSNINHYTQLTKPTGKGESIYFKKLFEEVSSITGVSSEILMQFAIVESSLNPSAKARKSNATGLFQFTPDTWSDGIKKFGKKYGITSASQVTDARANALMAGFHIKSNIELLEKRLGTKNISTTDIYLTHLLGRTGSLRYFKMNDKDLVATKMVKAARNNRKFFYAENKALTRKESYRKINTHIKQKVREFNISI